MLRNWLGLDNSYINERIQEHTIVVNTVSVPERGICMQVMNDL